MRSRDQFRVSVSRFLIWSPVPSLLPDPFCYRLNRSQNTGCPCHVCSATRPFRNTSRRSQRTSSLPPWSGSAPVMPMLAPPEPPRAAMDEYPGPTSFLPSDPQLYACAASASSFVRWGAPKCEITSSYAAPFQESRAPCISPPVLAQPASRITIADRALMDLSPTVGNGSSLAGVIQPTTLIRPPWRGNDPGIGQTRELETYLPSASLIAFSG